MADVSDNLTDLKTSNVRRITKLAQEGRKVEGLPTAYMMRMLEHLCGDALPEIQAAQELYTAEVLDAIEKQAREAALMAPRTGIRT